MPKYMTTQAAGMDLYATIDYEIMIYPMQRHLVPTGLAMAIPPGYEGQVRPRSGLAIRYGITVLNSPGTIDSDYRGEIMIELINLGDNIFVLRRGVRIAQIVFYEVKQLPTLMMDELDATERGTGGFGSTGN